MKKQIWHKKTNALKIIKNIRTILNKLKHQSQNRTTPRYHWIQASMKKWEVALSEILFQTLLKFRRLTVCKICILLPKPENRSQIKLNSHIKIFSENQKMILACQNSSKANQTVHGKKIINYYQRLQHLEWTILRSSAVTPAWISVMDQQSQQQIT